MNNIVIQTKNRVAAIIVSFNDPCALINCAKILSQQVDQVIVVDNCSEEKFKSKLSDLNKIENCTTIYLSDNFGISFAVNRGVESAASFENDWVLIMDQDSIPSSGMVSNLLSVAKNEINSMVVPTIADIGHKKNVFVTLVVPYAITSGSLLSVENFFNVGGFNEKLFIDGVDFDFSLKLRKNKIKIIRVPNACMEHKLGGEKKNNIYLAFHTVHEPIRRYYIVRNLVHNIREHGKEFPIFLAKLFIVSFLSMLSALIFGPKRRDSFIMMIKGICDGLTRKFGRLE